MRNARVKASSTDKLRFEVHASTRNGEGIPEKWYMKANHAIEVTRWVQSLQRAIDWSHRGRSGDSDAASIISTGTDVGTQSGHSPKKRFSRVTKNAVFGSMKRSNSSKKGSSSSSLHHEPLHTTVATEGYSSDEDTSTKAFSQDHPPHQESFELLGNTAATHIDLAVQLLAGLDSAEPSDLNIEETRASLKATIFQAQSMFTEYSHMTQEREAWFKAKLARERERAGIWEESLHKVVKEGEELEEELKRTIKQNKQQKRRSRALHDLDLDATVRQKPVTPVSVSQPSDIIVPPTLSPVDERTPVPEMMVSAQGPARRNTKEFQPPTQAFQDRVTTSRVSTQSDDSDSDEFFDAVEANALPNMVIPEPLKTYSVIPTSKTWIDASLFEGYAHPRKCLAISADNRPPVSLWAVLKGAIGKDLTVRRPTYPLEYRS
jgi:oxysterol-binding protein 1